MTGPDPGTGLETSALLQRLGGVQAFDLEVVSTAMVTPSVRRLRFTGRQLETLAPRPGQDLMVAVPADGQAHFRRRYSIRRYDAAVPAVELDIVLHGDGPGARWATAVGPGDRVEAIGPRGKILVAADADWHLFATDEAGLPAALSMAESLPAGATALLVAEVDGPDEEQPTDAVAAELSVRWQYRVGPPGTGRALADALEVAALPPGAGHAYLAAELRQVAAARSVLLDRGFSPDQIDHKAYWRLGVSNAAHGEPPRSVES